MAERRQLIEGLKPQPEVDRVIEETFVFGAKPQVAPAQSAPESLARAATSPVRVPFTTRVRADMAHALKRASLERQLKGLAPHTVQEILEEALEPWLRTHGYLP